MKKFSARRSFKKYTGHTKAMRKINKVKRGGMKKDHYNLITGKKSGGCMVFVFLVVTLISGAAIVLS